VRHVGQLCMTKKNTAGFTLIEVLIAIIILSIGLLGMAGIQLQGLRGTTSSNLRSQATILANDIAERVRVNTAGIDLNTGENLQYSTVNTANITCVTSRPETICSSEPGIANNVLINECSSQEMAAFDIYEFACGLGDNEGVNNLLPQGSATISCINANGAASCVPGSQLTIDIQWTDLRSNNAGQVTRSFTMAFVP